MDELSLLNAARRGDETSFLTLYHRYKAPLFRFVWRVTGSVASAEDIVQDCFLAALQNRSFDADRGSLRPYLFGIARNLAWKRLRVSAREHDEFDGAECNAGPFDAVLSAERCQAVADAVAALPPLQREAVILFEYEDFSLEEIAQVAGVETGAVKARLHRARETLRKRLAPLLATRAERSCS